MFFTFGGMFGIFFIIFIVLFVFVIVKMISQWNKNNHSPVRTEPATVVSKRTRIDHHMDPNNNGMSHTDTYYYVTFELPDHYRTEYHVTGREYGVLAEGDHGNLTYQGTRFLQFERFV